MADIYEQTERPAWLRILWYGLWAVVVIAVLWVLVWLIFFRTTATKKVNAPGISTTTQPSQSRKSTSDSAPSTGDTNSSSAPGTPTPSTTSTTPSSTTSPSELADTGPGDLVLPIVATSVVGSAIYYIRLRHRLVQS